MKRAMHAIHLMGRRGKRTVSTTRQGLRMGRYMRDDPDWDDLSLFKIILKGVGWFGPRPPMALSLAVRTRTLAHTVPCQAEHWHPLVISRSLPSR